MKGERHPACVYVARGALLWLIAIRALGLWLIVPYLFPVPDG